LGRSHLVCYTRAIGKNLFASAADIDWLEALAVRQDGTCWSKTWCDFKNRLLIK
jgi:hypothetical protein